MMDSLRPALAAVLGERYTVERELGGGGMSRVFLCRDRTLERDIVAKVLHPDLAQGVSAERFRREVAVAARLQHPQVVPLLDAGEVNGLPWYTMPYVEGESLRVELSRRGEFPVADVVRVIGDVARGLGYAHERGIVHRDVKPENILVSGGSAVLTDFGVARAISLSTTGGDRGLTSVGVALGTPQYMAPEQAAADTTTDHRADLYALGVVMYELLTGTPPFAGRPAAAILSAHATEEAEPVSRRRPSVPLALTELVARLMAKRPADRPQTARDVIQALEAAWTPGASRSTSAPARPRRHRVVRLIGACMALMTAAGLGALAVRPRAGTTGSSPFMLELSPPPGTSFMSQYSIALSPDGSRLALVALESDGQRRLWIRRLDSLGAVPVPASEGAESPFWSPDGVRLGWFARDTVFAQVQPGSPPRKVCALARQAGGAWTTDDRLILAGNGGLYRASIGDTRCDVLVPARAISPFPLFRPALTLDGRYAVVSTIAPSIASDSLFSVNLETGAWRPAGDGGSPTFLASGRLVYSGVPSSAVLTERLVGDPPHVSGAGTRLTGEVTGMDGKFTLSAGGTRVAFLPNGGDRPPARLDRQGRLVDSSIAPMPSTWSRRHARRSSRMALGSDVNGFWLVDLPSKSAQRLPIPAGAWPVFTADDRELVYWAWSEGPHRCEIRRYSFATRADTLLYHTCASPLDVSPDGRRILLKHLATWTIDSSGVAGIAVLDLATRTVTPLEGMHPSASDVRYSPDGRWLAYSSSESGKDEVYLRHLESGDVIPLSSRGGIAPRWSGDGRRLWFSAPGGRFMEAATLPGGTWRPEAASLLFETSIMPGVARDFEVSPDGSAFYIMPQAGQRNLVILDVR